MILIVLGALILIALLRIASPLRRLAPGNEVVRVTLGLRQRLLYQRFMLGMLAVALLLGVWVGWLSPGEQLLVVVGALALVAMPVRYRFTTTGFDINGVRAYAWCDFDGYSVGSWRVRLHGFAQADLWLTPDQQSQVLAILPQRLHEHRATPHRVKSATTSVSDL